MAKTANSKVIFMPGESGQSNAGSFGKNVANLDVVNSMNDLINQYKTQSVSGSPSSPSNRR